MAKLALSGWGGAAETGDDYPHKLSSPMAFFWTMVIFLIIVGFVAAILFRQAQSAFLSNPGLNGLILGVLLILAAYWTSSGSKYVADQIPMLISGGILGLGLAVIGVGLFIRFSLARLLRFWLARMVVEQQAQTDRVVDALARIEAKLGE